MRHAIDVEDSAQTQKLSDKNEAQTKKSRLRRRNSKIIGSQSRTGFVRRSKKNETPIFKSFHRKINESPDLTSSDRSAYAEVLVSAKSLKQISLAKIRMLERVTIETHHPLTLINLIPPFITEDDKNGFGISEKALLHSSERYYPETCRFASEVHALFSDVQGIHWLSRQEGNNSVFLLFGDRVPHQSLSTNNHFDALSVPEMRLWVPDASRYGVKIDDDLLQYFHKHLPDFDQYPDFRV